jgi:hypothetical protein
VPAPEIVASTAASFQLGIGETRVELAMRPPADPALGRSGPHRRVFLNVEKMTSTGSSGPWDGYLNLPPNEAPARHPELAAGELPMFGLVESSRSDATHAERGLYDQLEITELYDRHHPGGSRHGLDDAALTGRRARACSGDRVDLRLHPPGDLRAELDGLFPVRWAERHQTAVDHEVLSGDERRGIAGQEQRSLGDVVGHPDPWHSLHRCE